MSQILGASSSVWGAQQSYGRLTTYEFASCSYRVSSTRSYRRGPSARAAMPQEGGGAFDGMRKIAKQVQGALPIVGLLSRLGSPAGGIGTDLLTYPEFCRQLLYESGTPEFVEATAEWERVYGKVGQRRYVLLYLYMAVEGGGVVSGKLIMSSARRLRVTQDIEIEVERFENARDEIFKKFRMTDKPKGKLTDKIDIAVDSIIQVTLGLKEGEEVSPADAYLLTKVVAGGFSSIPDIESLVKASVEGRSSRKDAYKV